MKRLCYYINSDWYFLLHWKERAIAAIESGYEVHLICNVTDDNNKYILNNLGVIVHDSDMSEQSLHPTIFVKDIINSISIIKKIEPHILHCITIKSCLIGGIFSKLNKIKLVLSFVGLGRVFSSEHFKYKLLKKIVIYIYKWIASKKDVCFIFEHPSDRDTIVDETGIDISKTFVINGAGIDTKLFKYKEEPLNKVPVVLFASRVIWSKGLDDLIEAKKILGKEGVGFILNVAGITIEDDPETIPISILEEWEVEGHITWLGKSNNVKGLIEEANIVVLPSTYAEGIPRILIEAASIGRAAIAYDTGGCSSIISDNYTGFIVERKNVQLLAKRLKVLLLDPDKRKSFGICARSEVESKFSSETVIDLTLKIYSDINQL